MVGKMVDILVLYFKYIIYINNLHPTPWRRGRDSNPRRPCDLSGFRDRYIQPLCHLSGGADSSRIHAAGALSVFQVTADILAGFRIEKPSEHEKPLMQSVIRGPSLGHAACRRFCIVSTRLSNATHTRGRAVPAGRRCRHYRAHSMAAHGRTVRAANRDR